MSDCGADGWRTLAELAEDGAPIIYGILQPGPNLETGVPYVRPTEIANDQILVEEIRRTSTEIAERYRRSKLSPGDIILSIVGTIGKVALVPEDLAGANITQSAVRIRPRSAMVDGKYLAWALRSPLLTRQFDQHRLGTAVPRLNVAHVRELRIPVPPFPEQQRIVAEIEKQLTRLDAGVAALRRAQANLKRYRAAVLKAACEGRLVPTEAALAVTNQCSFESAPDLLARLRPVSCAAGEVARMRRKSGSQNLEIGPTSTQHIVPEAWAEARLDEIVTRFVDSAHRTPRYQATGIPALGPRDLVSGRLNVGRARLVSDDEFALQTARHVPEPGDVVFSRELSLGWAAELPTVPRVCLSQGMCLFRPHRDVLTRYLLLVLNGPVGRDQSEKAATGSAHPHINLGDIKAFRIPLPPLAEQHRIVAEVERRLSVVEEQEAAVATNLARAARLRQAILQRAFSGRLVPLEPALGGKAGHGS